MSAVEKSVQMALPTTAPQIAVPEIVSWENEMEYAQVFFNDDVVSSIVSAKNVVENAEKKEGDNNGTHNIGTTG